MDFFIPFNFFHKVSIFVLTSAVNFPDIDYISNFCRLQYQLWT